MSASKLDFAMSEPDATTQLRAMVAMGNTLLQTRTSARHGAIHYSLRGRLLWLAAFRERWVGFTRGLTEALIQKSEATAGPTASAFLPPSFKKIDMPQVLWLAASSTPQDWRSQLGLGSAPLYFRSMPAMPLRLMEDRHLYLLEMLANQPCALPELKAKLGKTNPQLAHDIARLLLVGAITTRPPDVSTSWPASDSITHPESAWTGEPLTRRPSASL